VDVGNPHSVVKPWKNNKTADKDALFYSIYFDNETLHVSSRFTAHHQEVLFCIHSDLYVSFVYVGCLLADNHHIPKKACSLCREKCVGDEKSQ